MLILLTHVHRKNVGIYGTLHLFQNIVTGLTKPCLKTKQYVNTVTNCLYSNSSFTLCFMLLFFDKRILILSRVHMTRFAYVCKFCIYAKFAYVRKSGHVYAFTHVCKRARFINWLFWPCILPKSQKPLVVSPVIFSFICTHICFRYVKTSGPKVLKGFILTSETWVSDQKLTFLPIFANFRTFKLLVETEDTLATQRYFVKVLLMVKYPFSKRMVVSHECIRCLI